MIESVEEFRAEFHFPGFCDQELLEQTQIDIFESRTVERSRRAISKRAVCGNRKCGRIQKESRRGAAEYARGIGARAGIWIANTIRPALVVPAGSR